MSLCLQSMSGHRWGLRVVVQLVELGFHCRVASGEFFNGDVLGLIVGEAEVAVGAERRSRFCVIVRTEMILFDLNSVSLSALIMIVAGIYLKGSCARIVALSGTCPKYVRLSQKVDRLELSSKPTQGDVQAFVQILHAYCTNNQIDMVCLNDRADGAGTAEGTAEGTPTSFRAEGIILATSEIPVKLIHSATVAAAIRKNMGNSYVRPTSADLGRAYDLAFVGLCSNVSSS